MKSTKKYHQLNVTLDSGVTFMLKARGEDIDDVYTWLDGLSGVAKYDEVIAVNPIKPHVTKKMEDKQSKITIARMNAGLTQMEFAELLGVSRQQAQRWEYGYTKVRVDTLKRIAKVLNVDWADLMEDQSKIAIARKKAGMTQKELAQALGVETTQAQRWENNYNSVSIETMSRIAEVLNVDLKELMDDD